MSEELTPGAHFGDFSVEELIGKGGMGLVYRATQTELQRRVALKIIAPSLASDPDFRDRFDREARRAAAIDHPAIIPIYATGEVDNQPYIAMRFVRGSDLASLIARHGRLDPARALAIVHQIADALDAAHAGGLVHRDVKPANILIEAVDHSPEHAYLTDFGLTRAHTDTRVTQTGTWMGTIDYMPPEQFQGDDIDGRADQYSLACVTYELLTGNPPFPRDAGVAAMYAHINTPPPRLTDTLSDLPTSTDDVIARAMAKAPADRFGTCEQFVTALDRAIHSGPGTGTPSPKPAAPRSPAAPTITGATVMGTTPTRRRLLAGAAAALLIAVVAVAVVLLATSGSHHTRTAQATTGTGTGTTTTASTTATAPTSLAFPAETVKQWLALAAQTRSGKVQYDNYGISANDSPQLNIWFGPKYLKVSYQNTAKLPFPALEEWLIPADGGNPVWGCIQAYTGWRCLRGGQLPASFRTLIQKRDQEWVTPVTTRGVLLEMGPARTAKRPSVSYEKAEDGRLPETCLDYTTGNIDRSACITQTGFLMDYTPTNLKKLGSTTTDTKTIFGYEHPVPLPANSFAAPAAVR